MRREPLPYWRARHRRGGGRGWRDTASETGQHGCLDGQVAGFGRAGQVGQHVAQRSLLRRLQRG
jgi:hypothetical protein